MALIDLFKKQETQIEPIQEDRAYNLFLNGGYFGTGSDNTSNFYINKIPHLKKGTDLICGLVSNLPIVLQKETNKGVKSISNDGRLFLLNNEVNSMQTSSKWKADIVRDLLLNGKAYSIIERDKNKIISIHRVEYVDTKMYLDNRGIPVDAEISYILNGKQYSAKSYEMLIIENPNGGVLHTNRETLNDIVEEYTNYKALISNTAMPLGVLKTDGRMTGDNLDKLKSAWQNLYTGGKNAGKTVILENGLSYEKISNSIDGIDFEKQEKVIGNKVENILNLPFGTLTNKNGSEDVQTLLLQTINPLIVAVESGLNKCLLLETEKAKNMKFIIDTREVLKCNDTEYQKNVLELFKSGVITLKQSKEMLGLDTEDIEKDLKLLSLGNVIQYTTGEIYIPNMNQSSTNTNNEIKEETTVTTE